MSRILILLNHPANRRLLLKLLRPRYEVIEAPSSPHALKQPFDLCILDNHAAQALQAHIQKRRSQEAPILLPFLLITAREQLPTVKQYLGNIADELLLVPIEEVEVEARVTSLLAARHHSMEMPRALVMAAPAGMIILHSDATVGLWNRAAEEILGWEAQQVLGQPLPAFWEDPSMWEQTYRRVLCGETVSSVHTRVRTRSGEPRIVDIDVMPLGTPEAQGLKPRVLLVLRDVTAYHQAREALRISEEKYRTLVERSLQGVVVIQDMSIVFTNQAFADMVGRSVEELLALSPTEVKAIIHPEDRDMVWQRLSARLAGARVPPRYEFRVLRKDGTVRWLEMYATRIEHEGRPAVQGAFADITERKQAEESLRRANKLLLALDQATAAMLRACSTREVISVIGEKIVPLGIGIVAFVLEDDQQGLRLTHYSADPDLVRQARAILSAPPEQLHLPMTPALRRLIFNRENLFYRPGATVLEPELAPLVRVLDIAGNVILAPLYVGEQPHGMLAFLGKNLDESHIPAVSAFAHQASLVLENLRLLEESRRQSERLRALALYLQNAQEAERARLAREIHDEFAQFLTAMRMEIDWLRRHLSAGGENILARLEDMDLLTREAIEKVRHIARQLRPGLLDDLGLLAAIEWQAGEFSRHSGITYTLHLPKEEPPLTRDQATALFRILQEALTNVARHAGATHVDITVEHNQAEVCLRVRDNGRGIAGESLETFVSLGLLGMRERAEALGGTFLIHGKPGKGTTVEVRLPL